MSIAKALFAAGNGSPIRRRDLRDWGTVDFTMFFDRPNVTRRFNKKERKVLGRTGAWSRGFMRRSIRSGGKKGKSASPGEPPRYHTRGKRQGLKDNIFFQADLERSDVVIGPTALRSTRVKSDKNSGAQLLEEGGNATIIGFFQNKATNKRARYRRFPFAGPAQFPTNKKFVEFTEKIKV